MIGSLAVLVGLRRAMTVIVIAGIIVAAGPMFFRLALTSLVAKEENI
jgi:H+/gluconate symporter-like permease